MIKTLTKDEELEKDVLEQLNWDTRVDSSRIRVEVLRGRVTLSGDVPSLAQRLLAEEDVRALAEAGDVDNRLLIRPAAPPGADSDLVIESHVKNLIRYNTDIDTGRATVSVVSGRVVLEGTVDTFWKKIKAASLAAEVDGVMEIHDRLSVVPGKNPGDEALAREIVSALERNTGVDLNKLNVSVENGAVTLSGIVTDRLARNAAEETVRCTAGVTGIVNNLVIEPADQE